MHTEEVSEVHVVPADKEKIKKIWVTAGILAAITAVEFAFAFGMDAGTLRTAIFVGLTIVKAFYIVGEFMHLKYEVKVLIWSVLIPMVFVAWMLVAFVYEGTSVYWARFL